MKKMLPIGKENFKKLIEENCYYVDKTNIISEILTNGSDVLLFPRPRRFGKTLTISMLENYFNITKKETNKDLFTGLTIDNAPEEIQKHKNSYPVIKLGLKDVKQDTYEKQYIQLVNLLSELYKEHSVVKEILDEYEMEEFEQIISKKAGIELYQNSLKQLSKYLERYYGNKVIILIDEYDAPIESGFINGFHDENIVFIRTLFSGALKTNDSLAFSVLTGILRVSQESMLSGLNNFKVYSVMSRKYGEFFGFTHNEVEEMFKYYDTELTKDVQDWYDGYNFGENNIYNPWSILNYVDEKRLTPYWANTGGLGLLDHLVKHADYSFKNVLKEILEGKSVKGILTEKVSYKDGLTNNDNLLNFMMFTGYLTYENERLEGTKTKVDYKCPNLEIHAQIENLIVNWFENTKSATYVRNFHKALFENNLEQMNEELNRILIKSISFYDSKEDFYHGLMVGLFVNMMEGYYINSNRESGFGRYDLTIESKKGDTVYIFEFKIAKEEEDLEEAVNLGRKQIDEKNYEQEYIKRGFSNIYKYGASFNKKRAVVV